MAFGGGGGNGQWVRTHDERSARAFLAEEQERMAKEGERLRRSRAFRHRMWARLRALLRRG